MEREYIDMGEQTFILINSPLIFLNLAANIFYACFLIFPPRSTPRLKQPLKMLLGCLVLCTISYCVFLTLLVFVIKKEKCFVMFTVFRVIVIFYLENSMTCFIWLNFFYYIRIVPPQHAVMIWAKRNIKSVMYMAVLFDGTLFLFCSAIETANTISEAKTFTYINANQTGHKTDGLYFTNQVCLFIIEGYGFLCLCIMMLSSFSTARYLHRHIKSAAQDFSTPRIQSQMRVTITGICQGVLSFLYITLYLYNFFTYILFSRTFFGFFISLTATSFYISGTTVNLGFGQTVFRQMVANAWRAFNELCGAGMITHDMKIHSSHHKSGEIPNTATVDVQRSV